MFLRSSIAEDSIKNDTSRLDDLLQWANSIVLEAQLMAHDAGVTAAELYTHLHMLRRRTILESSFVDLPQLDKVRLLIMSLRRNNLFGLNACKVQEWKRDTEEKKEKMISHVFEEHENREKAARKKTSSSARPLRSFSHQSPLDAIHPLRTKYSYQRPPGQSFQNDTNKQSSFRFRPSSSSKGYYVKDKKPVSQQSRSSVGNQSTGQGFTRKDKDKGSQQCRYFPKKGRGGRGINQRK